MSGARPAALRRVLLSAAVFAIAFVAFLPGPSWDQPKVGQDSETLWRWSVTASLPWPASAVAMLAAYQAQTVRGGGALANLRKAYAHDPGFPGSVKELARALVAAADFERAAGHPDQAMAPYQEALAVQPANAPARDGLEAPAAGGGRTGRSRPRRAHA